MLRRMLTAGALAAALIPAGAAAAERTTTFYSSAHTIPAYEAVQQVELVDHPPLDGYVTGLVADVVARRSPTAPPLSIRKVMLHHIVFTNASATDTTCGGPERFFAEGEEHTRFALPQGYGLPTASTDRWAMLWMLMNHARRPETVFVRYRVTYVTGAPLIPVRPYWLDANNCNVDPIYDVPGTGATATDTRSMRFTMPESGRIVAAGGHLHGGGVALAVHDEACGDRTLFTSSPTWGAPRHPYYTVRPILHEPGPIHMGEFTSATGLPVSQGDTLRLDAVYDNRRPHARVMGITILMVAHDDAVPPCAPLGTLTWASTPKGRLSAPRFTVPLFRRPRGPLRPTTTASAPGKYFAPARVLVHAGATLTWHFTDTISQHTLTWASGPAGAAAFSSPPFGLLPSAFDFAHTFTVPGTYRFFCSLHPASMVQEVRVAG
jgi:plastocyanin